MNIVTHNIYNTKQGNFHSLTVDEEESIRVPQTQIVRHGIYAATTLHFKDVLPRVFVITSLDVKVKTPLYKTKILSTFNDLRYPHVCKEVK